MSPSGYQAPVKRASRCGNERQERSGRRKAGRKGRGKNNNPCLVFATYYLKTLFFRFNDETNTTETVNVTKVGVIPTDLRMDIDYVFFYNNLTKLVITGVVPFVALCVFNFKIYAALRRRRQVRATFRVLVPEAAVNEI